MEGALGELAELRRLSKADTAAGITPDVAVQRALARHFRLQAAAQADLVEEVLVLAPALYAFVETQGSECAGINDDAHDLFVHWLSTSSQTCPRCSTRFFPLHNHFGGRPRSYCSAACKQAAWRAGRS
ncbi:hypothetical protein [Lentzea guizhouensis]|uniref:hypothetical protein n=1 Tax=Lentzea guizhouensis TaxID=1586287 RepID=UPI0012B69DAD|nr:hypothetical protein [Lentzea guizhouensis]